MYLLHWCHTWRCNFVLSWPYNSAVSFSILFWNLYCILAFLPPPLWCTCTLRVFGSFKNKVPKWLYKPKDFPFYASFGILLYAWLIATLNFRSHISKTVIDKWTNSQKRRTGKWLLQNLPSGYVDSTMMPEADKTQMRQATTTSSMAQLARFQ